MLLRTAVLTVLVAACAPHGPVRPVAVADPSLANDPINAVHVPSLRINAERVLAELIAALPAEERARVASVALVSDNALGDVNAYATCDEGGPYIAVSDGLLMVAAHVAQTSAQDELADTDTRTAYLDWLEKSSIAPPPPAFYATAFRTDKTKVIRQHELFDEEIAFVLGHELAHHYLGHLACNSNGGVVEETGQIASEAIPLFNQATEIAADVAGTKNVLAAGAVRRGYRWTEDGALLVLAAFNRRHPVGASDILFGFERSHPIPHIRIPIITSTAELWHTSAGLLPR